MSTQTITLEIPDAVVQRAQQAAEVLHHPIEEVLVEILQAALPDVTDMPEELRGDLMQMTWLDDQALSEIAHSLMGNQHQAEMDHLSDLAAQRTLTEDEQRSLERLRQEYGRVTLRKARAFALLSLRSGRLLLADN